MNSSIEAAIELAKTSPKAELHMHLEGALTPSLIMKFSERNQRETPYKSVEEIKAAYEFKNLEEFIQIYLNGFRTMATAEDYIDLANDYHADAVGQNIVHAEVFTEAQGGYYINTPLTEIMDGCVRAKQLLHERGFELLLLPTFLRHDTEDNALAAFDALEPYFEHMSGIGLASMEVGFPPENFRRLFDRARLQGFHLVAHAGEEGPPEYVWGALDELGVERIDHGNRAIEDPVLMRRLERDQVALTMCPLSNLRLKVVEKLEEHPLKELLDAGVKVTVNSDDPGYFGGNLNDNFEQIIQALGLGSSEVKALVQNSHEASFSPT